MAVLRRTLWRRILWRCAFWMLVLLAVLLAAGRMLAPQAYRLQPLLVDYLERQLDTGVSVSDVRAGWQGFWPYFVVDDLTVGDGADALNLGRVRIDSRPHHLFAPGRNVLRLEVLDAELDLVRHGDAGWRVAGLAPLTRPGGGAGFDFRMLERMLRSLGHLDFVLGRTEVHIRDSANPSDRDTFTIAEASLLRRPGMDLVAALGQVRPQVRAPDAINGRRFVLRAKVHPGGDDARNREVFADLVIQFRAGNTGLEAQGYVRSSDQPLAQWLGYWSDRPLPVTDGARLDVELWFDWQARLEAPAQLHSRGMFRIGSAAGEASPPAVTTDFELDWRRARAEDHWRLLLNNASIGTALPADGWALLGSNDIGGLSLRAEEFHLDAVLALAGWSGAAGGLSTLVNGDNAIIRDFSLVTDAGRRVQSASLQVDDLYLQSSGPTRPDGGGEIQGCGPLQVSATMHRQLGALTVSGREMVCAMPSLWREPLLLDQADAVAQLEQLAHGWDLRIRDARLASGGLQLGVAGLLRQRRRGAGAATGSSWLVDLHAALPQLLAARLPRYLPPAGGDQGAIGWIERAMLGGWVRDIRATWSGRIAPDGPMPMPQVGLQLEDVLMHYARGWPAAEQVDAYVRIDRGSLRADGVRARIAGADIGRLDVRIGELYSRPQLHLRGRIQEDGAQLLDLLSAMPLAGTDMSDRDYQLAGPVTVDTAIGVDLADESRLLYADGNARFKDVRIVTEQVLLTGVRGKLGFDGDGPLDSRLQARWGDQPAGLSWVRTAAGPEILLQGHFDARLVAHAALDSPVLIERYLDGSSDWQLRLQIGRELPRVLLASELRGVELRLPPPLSKHRGVARPLQVVLPLAAGERTVELYYGGYGGQPGDMLAMALLQDADHLLRGVEMQFGGRAQPPRRQPLLRPRRGALAINGTVPEFDPRLWAEAVMAEVPENGPVTGESAWRAAVDVLIEQLLIGDRNFGAVRLQYRQAPTSAPAINGRRTGVEHQLTASGRNLAGRARMLPAAEGLLVNIDLEHLHIPVPGPVLQAQAGTASDRPPPGNGNRRVDWITLNLIADQVTYQGLELGQVRMELTPMLDGLALERMEARSDIVTITASGGWREQDGEASSTLQLRLDSDDLGKVLDGLGYERLIQGSQATLELDVSWPGSIGEFELSRALGELTLRAGPGSIPKASPDAGRALGLISLQALPKRLFLDFSDLFAEGLEFDRARGKILFRNGIAEADEVRIEAAPANIIITGCTDLLDRTYNQVLRVKPNSGLALPIIGVLAGGPIGAGAGLALQGLFGSQIGDISELEYRITGPWSDPELTLYNSEPTVKLEQNEP